jgi:hypothetical protein
MSRFACYEQVFSKAILILSDPAFDVKFTFNFFMEDIYTEDLAVFISEYDIFIRTEQSDFFFKANMANIAILLVKYHLRAFDPYFRQFSIDLDLEHVHRTFSEYRPELITLLTKAYQTCTYADVIPVYQLYLTFYTAALGTALPDLSFDFYFKGTKPDIQNVLATKTFYTYLSCNHCAEYRQARFYMTRILTSHIGLKGIHGDAIISTLGCLYHDFYFHGNLDRVQQSDEEVLWSNRQFMLALHKETDKSVSQYGLYTLHLIQNEWAHSKIIKFDRCDFFPFFCYVKNNHLIMKREKDTFDVVSGFLKWIAESSPSVKSFRLNDWGEEGRGYTIAPD